MTSTRQNKNKVCPKLSSVAFWDTISSRILSISSTEKLLSGLEPLFKKVPRRNPRRGPRIKSTDIWQYLNETEVVRFKKSYRYRMESGMVICGISTSSSSKLKHLSLTLIWVKALENTQLLSYPDTIIVRCVSKWE